MGPSVIVLGITIEQFLLVYLVLALAMLATRSWYVVLTGRGKRTLNRPLDLFLFALIAVFMFLLPAAYTLWDPMPSLEYDVPGAPSWIGMTLIAAGWLISWKAHSDLGKNFTPSPGWTGDHALVTNGIYSRIRHPMYLGLLLWAVGMPLVITNLAVGVPLLPVVVAFCLNRIPLEERLLIEQFGGGYRNYMQRTGRLFPKLHHE